MKVLTISEILSAVNGRCTGNTKTEFSAVYTDSRKPASGGLFIALEGGRFDGHDFIKNAVSAGAAAVMCRKETDVPLPVIYVNDTREALLSLAEYYRSQFSIPVAGITGSVGKTTVKEMTALVLSTKYNTVKTQGNLNNDIGMPMTIFSIDETSEAAVIEMGMNHKDEISRLARVSKPDIGIITNIGVSHIENLGSRENILKAKLEILNGMKKGSPLILNGDNDLLSGVSNDDYDIIFFGIENDKCAVGAENIEQSPDGVKFLIAYGGNKYNAYIPSAGIHNVYNALAAFTAGISLGIEPRKAADALKNYVPAGMRQKITRKSGITFIEDCYNASPDSVRAGLGALAAMDSKRRIAVLGDMLELGGYSEKAHRESGKCAAENNVDILLAYGTASEYTADEAEKNGVKEVYSYTDSAAAAEKLLSVLKEGDAVLFKASRGMKLENVLNAVYEKLGI